MFSERLKMLRKAANLTQIQFAEEFNIASGTIANWETGNREPSLDMMQRIAAYFGVSIDYLLGYNDGLTSIDITEYRAIQELLAIYNHPEVQNAIRESSNPEINRLLDEHKVLVERHAELNDFKTREGLSPDELIGGLQLTSKNEKKLASVSGDEREDAVNQLVSDLSPDKKKEALRYLQYLASTEEGEDI